MPLGVCISLALSCGTLVGVLAGYYGGTAVRLLAALMGALYVLPYVIIQIKAGGTLAQALFYETDSLRFFGWEISIYDAGATALSLVTMLYVLIGGMPAWRDAGGPTMEKKRRD